MNSLKQWRGEVLLACVCVVTVVFAALWTRGDDLRRLAARNAAASGDETLSGLAASPLWVRPVEGELIEGFSGARRTPGGLWEMRPCAVFSARAGQSVLAMSEGTVLAVEGGLVTILHPDGVEASYGPLDSALVRPGEKVTAGQRIGAAADGELRLSVRRGGACFDPCSLPFS